MARVFSGIQPTGELHLGNLLGATLNWVRELDTHDAIYCIVDLHAITLPKDPDELRTKSLQLAQLLLATGLDPQRCTLFVQSHVPAHAELGWIIGCQAAFGELRRMTQFKDKSDRSDFVSLGLFAYPALQAADILLYDTEEVPVGDDQRQHVELTRDLAERFNSRFGDTFVVPRHVIPRAGARIMDLQEPTSKMSKSVESPQGTIGLLDEPAAITKKFKRAVTDSEGTVRWDPERQPGVTNLLNILAAIEGCDPSSRAADFEQYGALKVAAADAVVGLLEPIQQRYHELAADPDTTRDILAAGAAKARSIADVVLERARRAVGLR